MEKNAIEIQQEIDILNNNRFSQISDKMLMKITKDVKKICQYSLDGELIRIFNSARQAAREYNTSEKHIITAVRNNKTKGQAALGFIWGYENETIRIKRNEIKKGRAKTFLVFDSNMKLVNKFNSYISFCEFLNIQQTPLINSSIFSAIKRKSLFRGYWLIHEDSYTVGMDITKGRKQPVKIMQLTIDDEFIQEFKSLREVEVKLGICRKLLSEKLKTTNQCIIKGYKFQII